jgi:ankyrin repeat protein
MEVAVADIRAVDMRGKTSLHSAALSSELEIIKYLVEHGADIHALWRHSVARG